MKHVCEYHYLLAADLVVNCWVWKNVAFKLLGSEISFGQLVPSPTTLVKSLSLIVAISFVPQEFLMVVIIAGNCYVSGSLTYWHIKFRKFVDFATSCPYICTKLRRILPV